MQRYTIPKISLKHFLPMFSFILVIFGIQQANIRYIYIFFMEVKGSKDRKWVKT